MKKRLLILEDGSVYEGIAFGGDRYQMGELDLPDRNERVSGNYLRSVLLWTNRHDDLSCHGKLWNQP